MTHFIRSASFCFIFSSIITLCYGQQENFDIVIKRNKVVGNLVYCSVFLNTKEIGVAFENNDLKIATGTYKGLLRYNSGHNFVQSELGKMSGKGDFLLEVANVPGNQIPTLRTDILLHPGNLPKHSKGCILLGPVNKGPDGAVTIAEDHPLRKLRLAFYGTDDPKQTPNKNITITVKDDYIKTYNGNFQESPFVNFGALQGPCRWSVQMQNINITITVNRQTNTIVLAKVNNDLFEKIILGTCVPAGRQNQSYTFSSGNLTDNGINITLTPAASNLQKCNCKFTARVTEDKLIGGLTWIRYDQAPLLNYGVGMEVTLMR